MPLPTSGGSGISTITRRVRYVLIETNVPRLAWCTARPGEGGKRGKKMSVISFAISLIRNLVRALRLMHKVCDLAEAINTKVQNSNASDALKGTVSTWKDQTDSVCNALQQYYDNLPGD